MCWEDKIFQDSRWKFVFQSLRAGAALRSGEVIANSFSLASGKLINIIFGTVKLHFKGIIAVLWVIFDCVAVKKGDLVVLNLPV